ncbi:MAG: glutaredoxin family protein [Pseudomonadota bacterium]
MFYSTSACHLCEQALTLFYRATRDLDGVVLKELDVGDSDDLFERYGTKIPVLGKATGAELNWPFTEEEVRAFVLG